MLQISNSIIPVSEIEISAIRPRTRRSKRKQGYTAIHLRFNIGASSLPDIHRKSFEASDQRITKEVVL